MMASFTLAFMCTHNHILTLAATTLPAIIRIRGLCGPCELCPERDLAREVLEQAFPVLTASWMRFDIGFNGSLIWHQYMEEVQEGAYDEWRISAWTMFNEIPDLLRQSGYDLQTMGVEPLPGPWKWKFV
jgi:hypothetical protein